MNILLGSNKQTHWDKRGKTHHLRKHSQTNHSSFNKKYSEINKILCKSREKNDIIFFNDGTVIAHN